nr:hypothetical protein [uncultured Acetobacterium sp.]
MEIVKGKIAKCEVSVDGLQNPEIEAARAESRYGYQAILNKLQATRFVKDRLNKAERLTECFFKKG